MLLASLNSMTLAALNNLFGPDTLVIFLVILVFFGAKKLPELARSLGQAMREFTKAKDDFEREITRPPEVESAKQIAAPTAPSPEAAKTEDPHATPVEVHPPSEAPVTVHPPDTVPKSS